MRDADDLAQDLDDCSVLLVMGTSLTTQTAANIVADFGGHRIFVNKSVHGKGVSAYFSCACVCVF